MTIDECPQDEHLKLVLGRDFADPLNMQAAELAKALTSELLTVSKDEKPVFSRVLANSLSMKAAELVKA